MRIHGTTRRKPLVVFQDEERAALLPWDGEPYEIADWRNAKVHPDHHIQCQQARYSVPSDRCPPRQQVEIRLGSKLVHSYHRGQLIKTHLRQPKGGRSTDPDDYPAELSADTTRAPDRSQRSAATLGPAVAEFAERLFNGPLPWARIRQGHKLLRLGERYTAQRLDAATRRALRRCRMSGAWSFGGVQALEVAGPVQDAAVRSYQLMASQGRGDDEPVGRVAVGQGQQAGPRCDFSVHRDLADSSVQKPTPPGEQVGA